MIDREEWIMERAEELALDKHDTEYENLPRDLQLVMDSMAEREYVQRIMEPAWWEGL